MMKKQMIWSILVVLCSCKSTMDKDAEILLGKKANIIEESVSTDKKEDLGNAKEKAIQKKKINHDLVEMIAFSGGNIIIGASDGSPASQPPHEVFIEPFYLDKTPVTVAQFRIFIEATDYQTDAHHYGDAGVYNYTSKNWELLKGATWEYPLGPKKAKAKDDHPVTQVSWRDAEAFAKWAGKRLPTEYEWEFAAKNGVSENRYPWGAVPFPNGKYMANIWVDPSFKVQGDDGYEFTSPVGAFGEHPSGLTDMSGNVHEWTASQYKAYPGGRIYIQQNVTVKVIRGGAFTQDEFGVNGFTTTFRGQNTWETSLFNTGFRCAADK